MNVAKLPLILASVTVLLAPAHLPANEAPRLDPVFGEHMVLQRDQPVRLRGSAEPGARFEVMLASAWRDVRADAAGRWSVEFEPLPAGGPYPLQLKQGRRTVLDLQDVLVGDVFLCSGQSNMQWPVRGSSGSDGSLLEPRPQIRMLSVQQDSSVTPLPLHARPLAWQGATPESVPHFSAVCWFFARQVEATAAVPLGLVNASWGGSHIEAWISREGLATVDGFVEPLGMLQTYERDRGEGSRAFGVQWEAWWRSVAGDGPAPWESADRGAWKPVLGAPGDWKQYGDPELAGHHGMVWFSADVGLDEAQATQGARLRLGALDEVDATWVNGRFAGASFGWGTEREYALPDGFLQPGRNRVTVNVLNTWGQGGMLGPAERIALVLDDGSEVPIGAWQYRKVPSQLGSPPRAPWESVGGLTGLYNAMIAPLIGLRFAGALWYQGESNAGRGWQYRALMEALVADWRGQFGAGLPFMIVQLPGYGAIPTAPTASGWAEVREGQRLAAAGDPLVGLAVVLDVGDPWDIHPTNKQVVGTRLAGVARGLIYGEDTLVDGIAPSAAQREGDDIVLDFSGAGDTLQVRGSLQPSAFEACGDTQASCRYVAASLEGNLVRLHGAADALRVRHCWADAPLCNLWGASGVPVSTFEISVRR